MTKNNTNDGAFVQLRIVQQGSGFRVDYSQDGVVWEPVENTYTLERAKKAILEYLDILRDDEVLYETPRINTDDKTLH